MMTQLKRVRAAKESDSILYILDNKSKTSNLPLSKEEIKFLNKELKNKQSFVVFNQLGRYVFVGKVDSEKEDWATKESYRVLGCTACKAINHHKIETIAVQNFSGNEHAALLVAEGAALANYQFLKYKEKPKDEANSLKSIQLLMSEVSKSEAEQMQNVVEGVYCSRTLVNEPLSFLTAPQLSKEIQKAGKKAGFKVTVFDKKRIQKENFNGLLAVNFGSVDPPTFNILEWKPAKAKNKKPIILVGKGVVYDTGGMSLKPTANSMDFMKCDMGGAATVVGALYAVAKSKLPYHVIGLIPATDNRPGKNAYVPGDIVKMRDGLTVEVLNTDAEGRMILADALSYAKNYDPSIVLDFATLTGASARAVGPHAIAMMSKADRKRTDQLIACGYDTYERMVEFPLWKEYGKMIESDIADIKNLGGASSGGITAGKFLEHFTDYPWIHMDIAPTAWNFSSDNYRLKNGTGSGVRLMFDFIGKQ